MKHICLMHVHLYKRVCVKQGIVPVKILLIFDEIKNTKKKFKGVF